jgi:hypothetical protein
MAFSLLRDKADRNGTPTRYFPCHKKDVRHADLLADRKLSQSLVFDLHGIFHVFSNGEAGAKGSEGTESQKRAKRSLTSAAGMGE